MGGGRPEASKQGPFKQTMHTSPIVGTMQPWHQALGPQTSVLDIPLMRCKLLYYGAASSAESESLAAIWLLAAKKKSALMM